MHAVIERTAEGTTIIDLGSSDGTLVNGAKVAKRALIDGDVITLGEAELRVRLGEGAANRTASA
jgi:pSer/pThr/pTyr-binding forkhead associated (FHA) protein